MVTYLLGAGASCGTMPLATDISRSIEHMAEMIDGLFLLQQNNAENYPKQDDFCKKLKLFAKEAARHNTVDTYAKKLHASKKKDELRYLKCILSAYFTLTQIHKDCDSRYDSFWASLIQDEFNQLPDNIRVITWNYDSQLELSFRVYCTEEYNGLDNVNHILNINVNNNTANQITNKGKFGVYKLNGTANVYSQFDINGSNNMQDSHFFESFDTGYHRETVTQIIDKFLYLLDNKNRAKPTICFAWEHPLNPIHNETSFVKVIEEEIKNTESLVIIGYSFPFFNRKVDRELFKSMGKLHKIYIQDTNPQSVKSNLRSIIPNLDKLLGHRIFIEEVQAGNQFFLPPEL